MDRSNWNVPNGLTVARMALAVACFTAIALRAFWPALWLFLVAAGTDWVDGFWARRFHQVTQLGRVLDPFADKVIICGAFVFLVAEPTSGVAAWVAVVVLGRELLVTALRSAIEAQGGDFSAKWSGKWKMVAQCAAVALSLWRLTGAAPAPVDRVLPVVVWGAVLLTVYSGYVYVVLAARAARGRGGVLA